MADEEDSADDAARMARALGRGLCPGGLSFFFIDLKTAPRPRVTYAAHPSRSTCMFADQSFENPASGEIFRRQRRKRAAKTLDYKRSVSGADLWNPAERFP